MSTYLGKGSIATVILVLIISSANAQTLQPPELSLEFEAHSARTYMNLEAEFVKKYVFDRQYGGTYFSVDGQGNVIDSSKNILFETNIILFLAGLSSQETVPELSQYVDSAADFVVKYLKWGPQGPGTWYSASNRTGGSLQDMNWLAPSEAYISYGLLWAYRITGKQIYLDVARTNLDYQMRNFPDGHIMTDPVAHLGDVTYRSPERMTYYEMWQLTSNTTYLDYARRIQNATLGINGWERVNTNGTIVNLYLHGNAVLDEIQYALASGDKSALKEGQQDFEILRRQCCGPTGGNTRDDYQGLLAMDQSLWTIMGDTKYRNDAINDYAKLLGYWDTSPPYGFWATIGATKTCFSRGYPSLDITPPTIEADPEGRKVSAIIVDPNFKWLNLTYAGIGVNPSSVYLFYSLDGQSWTGNIPMQMTGDGAYTALVPQDVAARNPMYLVSASDYFDNTSRVEFTKPEITAPVVVASITSSTASSVPLVTAPTGSFGLGFAVIAAWLAGAALIVIAGLTYRPARRPLPPAGSHGRMSCRCPYWWECYRRHSDCHSCSEMRALGGCCMCLPEGARPGHCNHPPLDYRYIEPKDL